MLEGDVGREGCAWCVHSVVNNGHLLKKAVVVVGH